MTIARVVASTVAVIATVATISASVIVSPIVTLIATSSSILIVLVTVVATIAFVVATLVISTIAAPTVSITATIAIVILVVAVVIFAGTIVSAAVLLWPIRRLLVTNVVLLGVFLQLALLVVDEVVEYRHRVLEAVDDLQRLDSLRIGHLLGIARVCDGLVFVILQSDLPKLCIRDILDVDPAHLEGTLPLVLGPHSRYGVVIDGRHHLRDAAEVARSVHRKEQIHHTALLLALTVRLIQPLVAVFG